MNVGKKELRKTIREMKRQFTEEQLRGLSLPIIGRLLSHPAIAKAKTIMMYYSLPDEVCTHDAIDRLVQMGKTILLPRVTDGEHMEATVYSKPADLAKGPFDIMEPIGETFTEYNKVDVVVIPGMAFDTLCNRLGRGKGYYDRFLPKMTNAYRIGICFDFQKLDNIPTDGNDIPMDCII